MESHQLSDIILEYRRECGSSDIVQSLCDPDEEGMLIEGLKQQENSGMNLMNGFSLAAGILEGGGFLGFEKQPLRYTHLLQINGETKNEEIVRGRTTWKKKSPTTPFSSM